MKRNNLSTLLLLLTLLVAVLSVQGEMLGTGTYHGYFAITRWGHKVLHHGPYHLFVSDSAAQVLAKHSGEPLEVEVSKLSQPMNPGAGLVGGIAEVSEKGIANGLVLSAKLNSAKPIQGEGILLTLSLRNDSVEAITIWPGTLAITLVTDSPFSNKDIGYKDPDDCAYWYYSYAYHSFEKGRTPMRIACHRIILPWEGQDLVTRGQGIHVADKDRGFNGPIAIEPKGYFQAECLAGKELLPDDYEVFFYIESGNLSSLAGPMSDRLSFDVVKPDQHQETAEPPADGDGKPAPQP